MIKRTYNKGFNKIESPFKWVSNIFEEVFNGENTNIDCFYDGSCESLIKEQEKNYQDYYGVNYTITKLQKERLLKRWFKLKELLK